ncbi:MAG TPA: hypothetical protein VIL43_11570, partial [Burkholderiales bacterium]
VLRRATESRRELRRNIGAHTELRVVAHVVAAFFERQQSLPILQSSKSCDAIFTSRDTTNGITSRGLVRSLQQQRDD